MPRFDFFCPGCETLFEDIFYTVDENKSFSCPKCGVLADRIFSPPMIIGDTVAGGCQITGYDPALGVELTGRAHRREEMIRQGLVEYTPDPDLQASRNEAKYVRKHARPDEPEAQQALKDIAKEAGDKRKQKIAKESLSKLRH